MYKQKLQNLI